MVQRGPLDSLCWGMDTSLPRYQNCSLWALPLFLGFSCNSIVAFKSLLGCTTSPPGLEPGCDLRGSREQAWVCSHECPRMRAGWAAKLKVQGSGQKEV